MSQHMSYSIGFLLIVAMGFYFLYGNPFSAQQRDLTQFQMACDKYQKSSKGTYEKNDAQMLVNEINYLLPAETDINDPASKQLKSCVQKLSARLSSGDM